MNQKSISVFLPAYNEEENISEAIEKINHYLKSHFRDYEILIVNDGSKDQTLKIVQEMQHSNSNLRLVNHPQNLGYAQALRTGFQRASKDLIFYTDSDGQFDINDLDKLLPFLTDYDIVTGYRIKRQDPLMRIWMARIYRLVYRLIFGLKVRDIDCAFKLFKKEIFKDTQLMTTIKTGVINAEVYLKAMRKGYKLTEVGVSHYRRLRGVPSNEIGGRQGKIFAFVKPQVYWQFLKDTINLWINLKKLG